MLSKYLWSGEKHELACMDSPSREFTFMVARGVEPQRAQRRALVSTLLLDVAFRERRRNTRRSGTGTEVLPDGPVQAGGKTRPFQSDRLFPPGLLPGVCVVDDSRPKSEG